MNTHRHHLLAGMPPPRPGERLDYYLLGEPVSFSQVYGWAITQPKLEGTIMDAAFRDACARPGRSAQLAQPAQRAPGPCRNCGAVHTSLSPNRRCEYCDAAS